jgi:hypothetical protein
MKPFLLPIWPEIDAIRWPPVGLLGAAGIEVVVENLVATS